MIMSRRRWIVVGLALFVITYQYMVQFQYAAMKQRNVDSTNLAHRPRQMHNDTRRHDKWIVVTTIQAPTAAVRLMNTIQGWQLVVVGDKKTPTDWRLNGAIYLSPDDQEALNYNVISHIPYYSYSRKIIGYLYAIEHGAEYIYETDDDNFMSSLDAFHKNFTNKALVVKTNDNVFNPYQHFGQISMWPRGYPLESIGADPVRDYVHCSVATPAVQQGLVNGDPDVDAIYRMTRKHHGVELNVTFDTEAPLVILPNGVFSPYNSQNTFFTKNAFWSLILFKTITGREMDIYRSYWAQRLLWLTGNFLSFFAPKTVQERNAHSYNQDARDEVRLYTEIERLVEFLYKWKCNVKSFKLCVEQLTFDLSNTDFIGIEDVTLVKAWTADLTGLGYTWPVCRREFSICPENDKLNVKFHPNEQKASGSFSDDLSILDQLNNKALALQILQSDCNISSIDNVNTILGHQRSVVLLIISITDENAEIGFIDPYYRRFFSQIIYCLAPRTEIGMVEKQRVSYFIRKSEYSTECIDIASTMHYSVDNYMLITQNVMLAPNLLKPDIKMANTVWIAGDDVDTNPISHESRTIEQKGCLSNDKICIYNSKLLVETIATHVRSLEQSNSIDSTVLECIANLMTMNGSAVSQTKIIAMYIDQQHCDMVNNLHRAMMKNNVLIDHVNFMLEVYMYNCIRLFRSELKDTGTVTPSDNIHIIPNFNFNNLKSSQSEQKLYCKDIDV